MSGIENTNAPYEISVGAIKKENKINLFIVNSSNFEDTLVNLNINDNYKLKNKTTIFAQDYSCDKYSGVDEIEYTQQEFDEYIDNLVVEKNSVVLLEFEKDVLFVNSVDLNAGKIYYTTDFENHTSGKLACAIYDGKNLIDIRLIPNQTDLTHVSDNFDFGEGLKEANTIKLFAFENNFITPLCKTYEYKISKN